MRYATPRRRPLARQLIIGITTCFILPLIGLEVLFFGPEQPSEMYNLTQRSVQGEELPCEGYDDHSIFYTSDMLDSVVKELHWTRAINPQRAAFVFIGEWRQLGWIKPHPSCQRVNMVPVELGMLDKGHLASTMQRHLGPGMALIPETYLMYDREQCSALWNLPASDGTWIVEHTHHGGHRFVGSLSSLHQRFQCPSWLWPQWLSGHNGLVAQRFIEPPLLLDGRMYKVRAFWAIACTDPWIILYHPGYWHFGAAFLKNLPPDGEEAHDAEKKEHLAASSLLFKRLTFQAANEYLNRTGRSANWMFEVLEPMIIRTLLGVFSAYRTSLQRHAGSFLLLGADFFVTDQLKVYLQEIQHAPDLENSDLKYALMKPMLKELLLIQKEVRQKLIQSESLRNLVSIVKWHVLLSEAI